MQVAPFGWVLSLVVLGFSAAAAAAPCNRPDVLDTMPPDGAEAVPTNAVLFARYAPSAEYLDEEITLEHVGVGEQTFTGTFAANEGLVSIDPGGLVPGDEYKISWPRLRGLSTANLGKGKEVSFTVGTGPDEAAPAFDGLTGLDWDFVREKDDCTDSQEERFAFDLDLGARSDDGGVESLTLLVFQTRGPNIDPSAPEPVRVSRMPSGSTVRVVRTLDDSIGDVCFAAIARDLTNKPSASGNRETCVTTVAPPFFEGCSTAPARRSGSGFFFASLVALGLVLRRRS